MQRILLRQLLRNLCIFFVIVALHVSALYSRTDFTLVLKSMILVNVLELEKSSPGLADSGLPLVYVQCQLG